MRPMSAREHDIGTLASLTDGAARTIVAGGRRIVLVRLGDEVFAIAASCPHWNGPLGAGEVSRARREITCPWHRFRYDLRSGACVASNLRPAAATYPVRLAEGRVLVTV